MLPQNPPYTKQFLTPNAQIQRLKLRGLQIKNDSFAEDCLSHIGYYRLSGYWYPFRVPDPANASQRLDPFLADSHFEHALDLYEFDKQLKLLVWEAIEQVEIAIRVEIASLLGNPDPFAYTNLSNLDSTFGSRHRTNALALGLADYGMWMNKMNSMISSSKETFVSHYIMHYALPLPIWIAIELWDFGMMSYMYRGLKVPDKQTIALKFGVATWPLLQSWLRSLNFVRNVVAHHARLWNRGLADHPTLPRINLMAPFDVLDRTSNVDRRIYSVLCILSYLLWTISPTSNWKHQVVALATAFPAMPHAQLSDAGFPTGWQNHSFWK